jgi:hypothetical protein
LLPGEEAGGGRGGVGEREREVNYSSQLGFSFVVLFRFASSFWCARISLCFLLFWKVLGVPRGI